MLNSQKKTGTKLSRPVLLILFLAVLIIAGSIWISRLTETNQYFKAIQAAHRGKWPEAFLSFRALQQRSPGYRDVKARLEEAARNAITECAGRLDLQIEVEIIRWIANAKDYELLAESLDDCMVSIPEGKFILGSDHGKPDERPSRQITVDSFFLDRYEVTLAQYQRFLLDTDFKSPAYWVDTLTPPGRLDLPVVGVSWIQANAYCEWV
jgi:formylglycine-generating enzyme required for sulfatase activity